MIADLSNYEKSDSLKLYISNIIKYPLLTPEEEKELLDKIVKDKDKEAKNKLILGNLRLVVSIAKAIKKRMFLNMDLLDLINEGNAGLIEAIDKYDENREARFSTFASCVISNAIKGYVYKNSTVFKTSIEFAREARVFYHKLDELQSQTGKKYSIPELASLLNMDEEKIRRFFQFSTTHISLDEKIGDENDDTFANFVICENNTDPEENMINSEISNILLGQLSKLSEREQEIIKLRFGFIDGEPHTLEEVGQNYGLTRERIRQIEKKALKKLNESKKIKSLK